MSSSPWQNLVMLTLDCVRPDFLGCYGNTRVQTGNINRLASRGLVFEQAVSQAPCTWVSHAGIFTGTYPPTHGLRSPFDTLSPAVPTLGEILSESGFVTAGFPANDLVGSGTGLGRGFGFYYEAFKGGMSSNSPTANRRNSWPDTLSEASRWLLKQKGKRFFSWFHYLDTHHLAQYDLPEYYRHRFNPDWQFYEGKISYADENGVGRILSLLEDHGLHQNTLVVIFADHGEALGPDGHPRHNEGLTEDVLRIPLIFSSPGGSAMTGRVAKQVRTVDILPTVLALLGVPPPATDGLNLYDPFTGIFHAPLLNPVAYAENFPQGLAAIRTEEWKLVTGETGKSLFHLPSDPQEMKNLWGQNPMTGSFLEKELEKILHGPGSFDAGLSLKGILSPFPSSKLKGDEATMAALKGFGYI